MLRFLAAAGFVLLASSAVAAPYPTISQDVGVCDPNNPQNCLVPNSGGGIPVVPQTYTPSAPSGALTLATGGTAQNLFSAAEVVHGCVITNPSTATETIWVNFYTTAVGAAGNTSTPLTAGQSVGCPGGLTTAVSWIGATTGHAINAYKF